MLVVEVPAMLERFRQLVDAFAQHEGLAEHVIDIEEKRNYEAIRALDRGEMSHITGRFWQSRDWFFALQEFVPHLLLELAKTAPRNRGVLEKSLKFWAKPFRWSPKSANPDAESAKKYLSVVTELRKQLRAAQEAAAHAKTNGKTPRAVGKFDLFDSLGDESTVETATDVLRKATKAMTAIGLGAYCYGPVTLVESSNVIRHSAAFYVKNTDEIFLSPDLEGQDVRALCHEIAHRVHTKLGLSHKSRELYEAVRERGEWASNYAKTDAEENFCEMVSFAAIKKLPDSGKDLLRGALHNIKLASARSVLGRYLERPTHEEGSLVGLYRERDPESGGELS